MDLVSAFQQGNKEAAEHLLPHTVCIADIRTLFSFSGYPRSLCFVSLVHLAAYHGWLDVINNLITGYGCDVHCTDSNGHSSLHYAASKGHLEVVRHLISEFNCDPSCVNKYDDTSLNYACSSGHLDIVQYLISEAYCNLSCENRLGNTPLYGYGFSCSLSLSICLSISILINFCSTGRPHIAAMIMIIMPK